MKLNVNFLKFFSIFIICFATLSLALRNKGAYSKSCNAMKLVGSILSGKCKDMRGQWISTSLDLGNCITNKDGNLQTGGEAYQNSSKGCELLAERIQQIQPKIHVCGHIHTGYGYKFENGTHFFNASVLDEQYEYTQKPITFDWDKATNTVKFL